MPMILLLSISLTYAIPPDAWIVEPHQLSQLDLWIERAHGVEDRQSPLDILVDVDGSLVSLDTYQASLPAVEEKYPHWSEMDVPNVPLRIGVDQPGNIGCSEW